MKIDDEFLEGIEVTGEPQVEEIPQVPKAVKASSGKKAKASKVARVKEFDIRAAHQAWKEKNGIEDDYFWR